MGLHQQYKARTIVNYTQQPKFFPFKFMLCSEDVIKQRKHDELYATVNFQSVAKPVREKIRSIVCTTIQK